MLILGSAIPPFSCELWIQFQPGYAKYNDNSK